MFRWTVRDLEKSIISFVYIFLIGTLMSISVVSAISQIPILVPADYVIMTTNAIVENSNELEHFVNLKEFQGYDVRVITEDQFDPDSGKYNNQRPEKMRQWLIDNYEDLGIEYVLLIGDPDPDDPNLPYDIRKIITEVLDDNYFFEVHEHYAKNIVIGFGRLSGKSVGLVANQPDHLAGVLDINSSGNPGMARGGMGDVLAGILAGRLAKISDFKEPNATCEIRKALQKEAGPLFRKGGDPPIVHRSQGYLVPWA